MAGLGELANLAGIALLEEIEIDAEMIRRFHEPSNPFEEMTERQFKKTFRLTKEMVITLIQLLSPYMTAQTRASSLDIPRKVLTALKFFASGSYQQDIGSVLTSAVSQASVSRIIHEVIDALNRPEIFNEYVRFPRNIEELRAIRQAFFEKCGFPGVIGCVDCTHVAIYPPKIEDPLYPEAIYVNRKGYHSINVQLICDSNLRILNVNARFPGSSNDSYIWNNSNVLHALRTLHEHGHTSFFLLGDSGYPLRPWLLTPLVNPVPNTPEAAYNDCLNHTRSHIERCNGVLKMRFRCLLKHRVLHYTPETASKIINACVILHNMCIANNLPLEEIDDNDWDLGMYNYNIVGQELPANRMNPELIAGRRQQINVIRNHFNN